MLVLTRKSNQWTKIKIDRSKLESLLESGDEAEIGVKIYNVKSVDGKYEFKMALDDDKRNYHIERPERKKILT